MEKRYLNLFLISFVFVNICYSQKIQQMEIKEFKDGSFVLSKRLDSSSFNEILQNRKVEKVDSFTERFGIIAYKDQQGVMLVEDKGDFREYGSISDLEKILTKDTDMYSIHILYKKNPFGESFPDHANEMIQNLLKKLEVPSDNLLNRELLELVQYKILSLPQPYLFYRENFMSIVALVGKAILKNSSAFTWQMQLGSDKETWEVYLKYRDKKYPFFKYLYEDAFYNDIIERALIETYDFFIQ